MIVFLFYRNDVRAVALSGHDTLDQVRDLAKFLPAGTVIKACPQEWWNLPSSRWEVTVGK